MEALIGRVELKVRAGELGHRRFNRGQPAVHKLRSGEALIDESAGDHDLRLDIGKLELAVLEIDDPRAERLAVAREFDGEIEQALHVGERALPGPDSRCRPASV